MAERPGIGLLVPNLFLRVPLDSAVRSLGAEPVGLTGRDAVGRSGCKVVVVDLDVLKPDPTPAIKGWVRAGIVVLGFGPHVEAALLAAARQAGAVVLPRSAFLGRLPDLLAAAMATAGLATTPRGGEDDEADDDRS